jgi:hypothetical protein
MDWIVSLFASSQFWMGISLIALAVPGPQTRVLPWLFRAIAQALPKSAPASPEPK